jgi:hypothetical protein
MSYQARAGPEPRDTITRAIPSLERARLTSFCFKEKKRGSSKTTIEVIRTV